MSTLDPSEGPLAELRDAIVQKSNERGQMWIDKHKDDKITLHFVQDYGAAATAIQEQLEKGRYDLVAMGTHSYRGFRRFFLGSVAEATVRHAPCSVVVAHIRSDSSD